MLLYYSPQDAETAKVVRELESQAYEKGTLVLRNDPKVVKAPDPTPAPSEAENEDPFAGFAIRSAHGAIKEAPEAKRAMWVSQVEKLQGMLQRVERYRNRAVLPKA
jgi:hypothetical protein